MPYKNQPNLNNPQSRADDHVRRTLDVIDQDIAKLQKRKAELLEQLRQVEEYDQQILEETKKREGKHG